MPKTKRQRLKSPSSMPSDNNGAAFCDEEQDEAEAGKSDITTSASSESVVMPTSAPPSPRSHMTLTPHPLKDKLILFGGEIEHRNRTSMYNDLYMYDINTKTWTQLNVKVSPPPRSSHQACAVNMYGGQLWVFGGETTDKKQVKHHRDLWCFHLSENKWELIRSSAGSPPSARSGHRMVEFRRHLLVFGGFIDNNKSSTYYNDVHAFSLDDYTWTQLQPKGPTPSPRSACQVGVVSNKGMVIYGGYSCTRVGKEDTATTHSDMFMLTPEDTTNMPNSGQRLAKNWRWKKMDQSGEVPSPRIGMTWIQTPNNRAVSFGGVFDEVQEDDLEGRFFNDLFMVDLENGHWFSDLIRTKKLTVDRKRRRCDSDNSDVPSTSTAIVTSGSDDSTGVVKRLRLMASMESTVGIETIGSGHSSSAVEHQILTQTSSSNMDIDMYAPPPRTHPAMAVKGGQLFVFGGFMERGDDRVTLADFYSLDLCRLTSWEVIIPYESSPKELDSIGSPNSDSDISDTDSETDSSSDMDTDTDRNINNAIQPRPKEPMKPYRKRTADYWLQKARENSKKDKLDLNEKKLQKLANELAAQFYCSSH